MVNHESIFMRHAFPCPPDEAWYIDHALPPVWSLIKDTLKGRRVLDIGCASGWVAYYARLAGATVFASDIFETMVHPTLPFVLADKEHLPFGDGTLDGVLTSNTLHHGDLLCTVDEVARVLKPGGLFASLIEPCIPRWTKEYTYLMTHCAVEMQSGIDERRPHLWAYWDACRGFAQCQFYQMDTLEPFLRTDGMDSSARDYEGGISIVAYR